jgi:hypothetical protein
MSVERLEESPFLGTLNQKLPYRGVYFMSVERLELSTNGLKGRCSTIELHTLGRGGFACLVRSLYGKPPSDIPETRVAGTSARHCIIPPFQRQSLDHGSSGLYHNAHAIPTNPIKIIPETLLQELGPSVTSPP